MPTVVFTRVHHVYFDLLVVFESAFDFLKVLAEIFERVVIVDLLEFQLLSVQPVCVAVGLV